MSASLAITLIDLCAGDGELQETEWLLKAKPVHRKLRPNLPADYEAKMRAVFASGGRMTVAAIAGKVVGLSVWRVFENTFEGIRFYVDDLVTDEAHRSCGVGKTLVAEMAQKARRIGAESVVLDSGTQRQQAHRFYFREGFVITSFNFKKQLV